MRLLLLLLLLAVLANAQSSSCVPGTVTCCISVFSQLLQLYVDEVDLTSTIQGDLTDYTVTKTVQFPEPSGVNATFSIKARERNEIAVGTLMVKCVCDRPGCLWNFDSEPDSGQWKGMPALVYYTDSLSPGWYLNNRTAGLKQTVVGDSQDLATITGNVCGVVNVQHRLKAVQLGALRNEYWAFRRMVGAKP
ncbi:hypothetical protein BASA82_001270, partial [Batrachochytrium salamandrivorans]